MKDFFLHCNVVYYFREKSRGMTHNRSQFFSKDSNQYDKNTKTRKQLFTNKVSRISVWWSPFHKKFHASDLI